jgi:hypothetical protein
MGFKARIVERNKHYYSNPNGHGGSYCALEETYNAIDSDRTAVNPNLASVEYLLFSVDDYGPVTV